MDAWYNFKDIKNIPLFIHEVGMNIQLGGSNMKNQFIELVEKSQLRSDIPEFKAGDTIQIYYKVKEGAKERIQLFQGVCIAFSGQGLTRSFTVRKVTDGIGVERIFPLNSPLIDKLEVKAVGRVRRAKLYYLRGLSGKASRIKEIRR